MGPSSFHSTISTRSRIFRHLFDLIYLLTLHVRWLSHICNTPLVFTMIFTALSNYHLIDWWCDVNFCLFNWWFNSRFLFLSIWHGKTVDSSSHPLSLLHCKQIDQQFPNISQYPKLPMSYVVRQLVRQLVYTKFVSNNCASFNL